MALYSLEYAICPWCDGQSGRRVDHLYGDMMPAILISPTLELQFVIRRHREYWEPVLPEVPH